MNIEVKKFDIKHWTFVIRYLINSIFGVTLTFSLATVGIFATYSTEQARQKCRGYV